MHMQQEFGVPLTQSLQSKEVWQHHHASADCLPSFRLPLTVCLCCLPVCCAAPVLPPAVYHNGHYDAVWHGNNNHYSNYYDHWGKK